MSNLTYSHTVTIAAPLEQVFALAADFTQDPRWRSEVREMRHLADGPISVGSHFREYSRVFGQQMETTTVVTEYDMNCRAVAKLVSGAPSLKALVSTRTFAAVANGTRFTYTLETEQEGGLALRLLQPIFGRLYAARLKQYVETLKAMLEHAPIAPTALPKTRKGV